MRSRLTALFLVLWLHPILHAQAIAPTAISSGSEFRLPAPDGMVHYVLTFSELFETGSAVHEGPAYLSNISGDLSYQSQGGKHPFSMLYAGGWGASTDAALPSTTFHNLVLAQNLIADRWSMGVSNSFSYLPYAPSAGLSGIPGLGDIGFPGAQPGAGPVPTLLTNYASFINDSLSGNVNRQLNYDTYLTGAISWGEEHFLSGIGLNTAQLNGTAGFNRRLGVRSSIGANYAYSRFSYNGVGFSFTTQGLNVLGQHQWTRALSTTASVGPQLVRSSDAAAVPSHIALAATFGTTYSRNLKSVQLTYTRGSVGGFGVLPGAFSNSIQAEAQQALSRNCEVAITGTYLTVSGLGSSSNIGVSTANTGRGSTRYVSLQATRSIGRSFKTYLSYTAQYQSFDQSLATRNALDGLSQIVGTGISFRPQPKRVGEF